MTTIAYKDGVLAADSQINSGNGARAGSIRKIGRTNDGHLWAVSGSVASQARCIEWMDKREGDPPDLDGVLIHVRPDGSFREWWGKGWLDQCAPWSAWGSGERIARGAMFVGAGSVEAVAAAIAIDTETGGDLCVETLS